MKKRKRNKIITSPEEGIKKVNSLKEIAEKNGQNILHITIHPSKDIKPSKLLTIMKGFLKNAVYASTKHGSYRFSTEDFSAYLSVIEYGHQITNIENQNINRLGTHVHTLVTTKKGNTQLKKELDEYLNSKNIIAQVKITSLKKTYNTGYWVKQLSNFDYVQYDDSSEAYAKVKERDALIESLACLWKKRHFRNNIYLKRILQDEKVYTNTRRISH